MQYKRTIRIITICLAALAFTAFIGKGSNWLNASAGEISQKQAKPAKHKKISLHRPSANVRNPRYYYKGRQFTEFVDESYSVCNAGDSSTFYKWMNNSYNKCNCKYPTRPKLGLEELLASKKLDFKKIKDPNKKTDAEIPFAAWVHKMVKCVIPKFSLDRGFEFCNVVNYGERQCYLQAILISGILQDVGFDAGVVMVYKSISGQVSNNGHAVCLVKLPNGQDIIVDASEPKPFANQQGLFVMTASGYLYVEPVYAYDSARIISYMATSDRSHVEVKDVKMMDIPFIRSQFWYYRGERAKGGIIASKKTKDGLNASADALQTSVKLCPQNPLSVYMLGRVYFAQGNTQKARPLIKQAVKLYSEFGWVPDGPKQYLKLVN